MSRNRQSSFSCSSFFLSLAKLFQKRRSHLCGLGKFADAPAITNACSCNSRCLGGWPVAMQAMTRPRLAPSSRQDPNSRVMMCPVEWSCASARPLLSYFPSCPSAKQLWQTVHRPCKFKGKGPGSEGQRDENRLLTIPRFWGEIPGF